MMGPKSKWMAGLALALMLMAGPAFAGQPFRVFIPVDNELATNSDDQAKAVQLKWYDGDVRFYVKEQQIGLSTFSPVRPTNPLTNPNGITGLQVYTALNEALDTWNSARWAKFKFFTPVIPGRLSQVPGTNYTPSAPVIDGINLISFLELTFSNTLAGDVSISYFRRDVDFDELLAEGSTFPFQVISNFNRGGFPPEIIGVDMDNDGELDLFFPSGQREFDAGTIFDVDIVVNQTAMPHMYAWPEDFDDIPQPDRSLVVGSLDVQALFTNMFGQARGLADSMIIDSAMYRFFEDETAPFPTDPYRKRKLAYDDEIAVGIADKANFGGQFGTISGSVIDGAVIDGFQDDGGGVEVGDAPDEIIVQAPVFLCVRPEVIPGTSILKSDRPNLIAGDSPDDVVAAPLVPDPGRNSGTWRKMVQVLTGQNLVISSGVGLPPFSTLVPVGGDDPVFDAIFFPIPLPGTEIDPGVQPGGIGGGAAGGGAVPGGAVVLLPSAEQVNSQYIFPGVPPTTDQGTPINYAVRLENNTTIVPDIVYQFFTTTRPEVFVDEFYGGPLAQIDAGNGTFGPVPVLNDDRFQNLYLNAQVDETGRYAAQINGGSAILSGMDFGPKSYFQVKSPKGTFTNKLTHIGVPENGRAIDDVAGTSNASWLRANDFELTQDLSISNDGGIAGTPDGIRVAYTLTNKSPVSATFSMTQYLDTYLMGRENPRYVVNLLPVDNAISYLNGGVPAEIRYQSSLLAPSFTAFLQLRGFGLNAPTRVTIAGLSDLGKTFTTPGYPLHGPQAVNLDSGISLSWENVLLQPDEARTFSYIIGFLPVGQLRDTWFNLIAAPTPETPLTGQEDDPGRVETVTVEAGEVRDDINIITNTGQLSVNTSNGSQTEGSATGSLRFELQQDAFPTTQYIPTAGALADIDNDGDLDMVLAGFPGGADPIASGLNRLYENRQRIEIDGSITHFFVDVTFGPDGIPGTSDDRLPGTAEKTVGVVVADFDNDGDVDIYFSNRDGQDRFYTNIGFAGSLDIAGKFEDHSAQWLPGLLNRARPFVPGSVPGGLNNPLTQGDSFRAVAGDIDSDGDLDLIVSHNTPFTDERYTSNGQFIQLPGSQAYIHTPRDYNDDPWSGIPDGAQDFYSETLEWTETVLVNMTIRTPYQIAMGRAGGNFFLDETLGEDNRAGISTDIPLPPALSQFNPVTGLFEPIPEAISLVGRKIDRMPPVYPTIFNTNSFGAEFDPDDLEIEETPSPMGRNAVQPILGAFFQSSALDLVSIRSFATLRGIGLETPIPITLHPGGDPPVRFNIGIALGPDSITTPDDYHGQETAYFRNSDLFSNSTGYIGRDNIADGYFACINYGMDSGDHEFNNILFSFFQNLLPEDQIAYLREFYGAQLVVYTLQPGFFEPVEFFQDYMPLAIGVPSEQDANYTAGDYENDDMVNRVNIGQTTGMLADWDNTGVQHAMLVPSPINTNGDETPDNVPFYFGTNVDFDGTVGFGTIFGGDGWRRGHNNNTIGGWANVYLSNPGTTLASPAVNIGGDPWVQVDIPYAPRIVGDAAGQPQYAIHDDWNLDGFEDIFLATGSVNGPLSYAVDGGVVPADLTKPNHLFQGTGRADNFVEASIGLVPNDPGFSSFAMTGDVDNDGDKDIVTLNILAPAQLYKNQAFNTGPDLASQTDPTLFYEASQKMIPPMASGALTFPFPGGGSGATGISVGTTVGDLDGDGKPDLAIAEGGMLTDNGDNFRVMFNRGGPYMDKGEYVFQPAGSNTTAPVLMNTSIQVSSTETLPGQIILTNFVRNGFHNAGSFPFATTAFYRDIAIGDVDNDGDQDILAVKAANEGAVSPVFSPTGPELFRNLDSNNPSINSIPDTDSIGDGIFRLDPGGTPALVDRQSVFGVSLKNQARRIRLADVNHDGLLDAVIANGFEDNGAPNVLMLNVGGSFIDATDGPQNHLPISEPDGRRYGVLDNTVDAAVADFDHDGNMDIIFINASNTNVPLGFRFLKGDQTGHFTETTGRFRNETGATTTFLDTRPFAVAVGDLDGIGETTEDKNYNGVLDPGEDLNQNGAIDWVDLPTETEDVNGNGTLDAGEDTGVIGASGNLEGSGNGSIDAFDSNNDGVITARRSGVWEGSLDLYVTFQDISDKILINDPTNFSAGTFMDRTPLLISSPGAPGTSRGVSIGDIDLDGDPDIVVARFVGGSTRPVRLWMNTSLVLANGKVRRGIMTERSHEIPFNRAFEQVRFDEDLDENVGELDGDDPSSLTGWAIDVDLIDIDGDRDLDIFVTGLANSSRLSVIGAQEAVYINRLIGEGFQHQTRQNIKTLSSPTVFQVTPRGSNRGKTVQAVIDGMKFVPGMRFDFGTGIVATVNSIDATGSRANVTLNINTAAPYGPRRIVAANPEGGVTSTKSGAFYVFEALADGIQTEVPNMGWTLYE